MTLFSHFMGIEHLHCLFCMRSNALGKVIAKLHLVCYALERGQLYLQLYLIPYPIYIPSVCHAIIYLVNIKVYWEGSERKRKRREAAVKGISNSIIWSVCLDGGVMSLYFGSLLYLHFPVFLSPNSPTVLCITIML